jgi:ketosteroid isomerase-like protein
MSEMLRILQRGYELIWREDRIEHALRGLGEDFEWVVPDHPDGARRQGPDAAIEFFHDWRGQFEDLKVDWELQDIGASRALALTSTTGRGRISGAPAEMRFAQLWTFRDGRFVRMVMADTPLLAIVRDGSERYRCGGFDAILELCTENVAWEEKPECPDGESISVELEESIERARFFPDPDRAREAFESE